MSIKDFTEKIKPHITNIKEGIEIKDDFFILALIALTGLSSYGLGKLSIHEIRPEIKAISSVPDQSNSNSTIRDDNSQLTQSVDKILPVAKNSLSGPVYASKNGIRYYYSWCSGLSKIKEENKVTFSSKIDAESAGLTLASGCN